MHIGNCIFCGELPKPDYRAPAFKWLDFKHLCDRCGNLVEMAGGFHKILPHLGRVLRIHPLQVPFVPISTFSPQALSTSEDLAAWELRRLSTNPHRLLLFLLLSYLRTEEGQQLLNSVDLEAEIMALPFSGVEVTLKSVALVGILARMPIPEPYCHQEARS